MDSLSLTISIITIFLLFLGIVYLIFFLPKRQEKLLKLRLDILNNQQKETGKLEENKTEEAIKASLELKGKIEEISQKLKTSEEVIKALLENVDKSVKGEVINQQKLFQEKNKELSDKLNKESKELSEKLNKDLELRLNNNQQLIKTHLE